MGSQRRKRSSSPAEISPILDDEDGSPTQDQKKRRRETLEDDKENIENQAAAALASMASSSTKEIRRINTPGKPPEVGVIKKVYVENFMCHRKLTVDLCRNVNFISGQNGSGKSAILAAVQICLGAGARRTHRARNLKELVRKEASASQSAKVRVTLLNAGEDGFQKDVYGDTITVERSISKGGGYNGYKLLDHEGKERSRSKKDLDAMLDHLNIQVENPVAVLDQEESKKFLTGKDEDKHAFFMKATELERLDRTYQGVVENLEVLEGTKERVSHGLEGAVANVKSLQREWQQFQELDKLEEKVLEFQVDYAWAFFNGCDGEYEHHESVVKALAAKLDKRRKAFEELQAANTRGEDEEEEKKQRMNELSEEAREAASAKTDLEAELKRTAAPLKSKERELAHLKKEQKKAAQRLDAAKRYLQETREQILQAAGSAKSEEAQRTQKLQQVEQELERTRQKALQLRQALSESLRKYEDMEPQVKQARAETDKVERQVNAVNYKIRDLQSSESFSLAMFGQKCAKVHQMVEQARRRRKFRGKVIGPIGAHIKIAPGKEHLAQIAEHAIGGGVLDRFIVTCHEDRQAFMKIRSDAGCHSHECGVFQTSDGPRYRVPPAPGNGIETVAGALQIADDLVFNTLVDNSKIDLRALAESKEISERQLLVEGANHKYSIRGKFQNVYFLPDGDYWTVKSGNRQTISNERKVRQTIGVDRSVAIESARREVAQLRQDLEELRSKEAQVKQQHKEYKVVWNNEERANRENKKRLQALMNTIEELKADADAAVEDDAMDTTELEEDVSNAEQMVVALQEQREEKEKQIETEAPALDEIRSRLDEVAARNEKVLADLEAAEAELNQYFQNLSQTQSMLEKREAKVKQTEAFLRENEEKLDQISEARETSLRKARILAYRRDLASKKKQELASQEDMDMTMNSTASSQDEMTAEPPDEVLNEIEPKRTRKEPTYYRTKIERMKKRIADEKERRRLTEDDPEVAYEKYMRAKNDLDAKRNQIDIIGRNVTLLTEDMRVRESQWKRFRKHIEQMSDFTFDEMLQKRGSSGKLVFDHDAGTLQLNVQKNNMNEMSQTNDVKALSGGERSFVTLSLLLALGEQLETPFRVMDEFDVFMDPFNRKIALQQLVEVSKEMEHRQFIFITPQDLSSLKPDPMLKIHRMKPPARNSTVGGPSQQTLD